MVQCHPGGWGDILGFPELWSISPEVCPHLLGTSCPAEAEDAPCLREGKQKLPIFSSTILSVQLHLITHTLED